MTDTHKFLRTVKNFTNEVLNLAEEKGLTVEEIHAIPDALKNKLMHEMPGKEQPYKRSIPQEGNETKHIW